MRMVKKERAHNILLLSLSLSPSHQTTPKRNRLALGTTPPRYHYSEIRNSTPSASFTCSYVTKAIAIDGTTFR